MRKGLQHFNSHEICKVPMNAISMFQNLILWDLVSNGWDKQCHGQNVEGNQIVFHWLWEYGCRLQEEHLLLNPMYPLRQQRVFFSTIVFHVEKLLALCWLELQDFGSIIKVYSMFRSICGIWKQVVTSDGVPMQLHLLSFVSGYHGGSAEDALVIHYIL